MNDKISTLLDGELDREEAIATIRHLGADAQRRATWDSYHLIGDVLRGEDLGEMARRRKSTEVLFAKLAAEPTVIAPAAIHQARRQSKTRIAMAMAASIVTVSAIAVIAMKQQSGVVAPVQMVQQNPPQAIVPVAAPVNERVNDYLVIHRQFANRQGLQTASTRGEAPRAAAGK